MNARFWNDVLRLLCMMILIDGKVYEEELEAFKDAALTLRDMVDPKLMLTGHMAEDWFELNRDDIAISIQSVFYDGSVAKALKNLDAIENKKSLIFALLKVAMSDGRKHPAEEKLLNSACETWGLDLKLVS